MVVATAGVAWEEPGQLLVGGLGAWGLGLEPGLLLPGGSSLCFLQWAEQIFMPASYRTLFSL